MNVKVIKLKVIKVNFSRLRTQDTTGSGEDAMFCRFMLYYHVEYHIMLPCCSTLLQCPIIAVSCSLSRYLVCHYVKPRVLYTQCSDTL